MLLCSLRYMACKSPEKIGQNRVLVYLNQYFASSANWLFLAYCRGQMRLVSDQGS